jgi:hypothetical protein
MSEFISSPQAIVLGGGLKITADGQTELATNSLARADRAIELYLSDPKAFDRSGSVIVCTGRATQLSDKTYRKSEASLMADKLLAAKIPIGLIETEETSNSTVTNFLNSSDILEERTKLYTGDEEPLLSIVTQAWHYDRRAHFLGVIVLDRPMQNAVALGEADMRRRVQEASSYLLDRLLFAGVQAGDKESIRQRTETKGEIVDKIRPLVKKVWK